MTEPQHHFGSLDPEDRPVPLVPDPADELTTSSASDDVLGVAERLVREAQQEIGREDTEPSMAAITLSTSAGPEPVVAPIRRGSRRLKLTLLALATLAAFLHGWQYGETTATTAAGFEDSGATASGEWIRA